MHLNVVLNARRNHSGVVVGVLVEFDGRDDTSPPGRIRGLQHDRRAPDLRELRGDLFQCRFHVFQLNIYGTMHTGEGDRALLLATQEHRRHNDQADNRDDTRDDFPDGGVLWKLLKKE